MKTLTLLLTVALVAIPLRPAPSQQTPAQELEQIRKRIAQLEAELAGLKARARKLGAQAGQQTTLAGYLAKRRRQLETEIKSYVAAADRSDDEKRRAQYDAAVEDREDELMLLDKAVDAKGRAAYLAKRKKHLAWAVKTYKRMRDRGNQRLDAFITKLEDELATVNRFLGAPPAAGAENAPSPEEPAIPLPAGGKVKVLWAVKTKSDSKGSAAVADIDGDGKLDIVFGTYFGDRHVYAVSAHDGKVKWKFESDRGPLDASIAIADVDGDQKLEILAADSSSGNLFCLDGKGQERWRLKLPNSTDSPPAVADLDGDGKLEIVVGSMWLGDRNGNIGVYRASDRKLVWQRKVPGCVQSAGALVDLNGDRVLDVIVTSWRGDRGVHAFSGKDGKDLWRFETEGTDKSMGMYHGVTVTGNPQKRHLVVATCDGDVYGLTLGGKEKWRRHFNGEYLFAPTVAADVNGDGKEEIVVGGRLHVYVLRASNGKVVWKKRVRSSIHRGAAVVDADGDGDQDIVFFEGTTLRVLDGKKGKEILAWDARVNALDSMEKISSAPVVADFDGDGKLDVFFVVGRGYYGRGGKMREQNFGRGYAVRLGGKGPGWTTFRGNLRRTGRRDTGKP